jgi:heme-binding NEAT domain protein
VASEGGTQVKLRRRCPRDAICTIVYHGTSKTPLEFDNTNRGDGDVMIYGVTPPEEKTPEKPGPTSAPTTMPASAATSKPNPSPVLKP